MSKAGQDWSQDELEQVATCLEHDLRSAGPRFAIEFTALSAHARRIASAPPADMPHDFAAPGSGGFIEVPHGGHPDWLPEPVKQMLGYMHGALGEPAPVAIALYVDGSETMCLDFWSDQDHLEQLAGLIDQVQDVVMETTHERWPKCPAHEHELVPRPSDDWVEWECPDTGAAIVRFGRLASRSP